MRRNNIIVVNILIFLLISICSFSGCLQPLSEGRRGIASIPEILIDYDFDSSCFKIYVKSAVSDFKYEYIKIGINGTEKRENNTYVMYISCLQTDFSIEVEAAVDKEVIYESSLEVIIVNDKEKDIFVNIIDTTEVIEEENLVSEDDLPWKKILVQRS